ncbi:MAG: hypothetical protein H6841_07060 [Planctomycetes bacterium]|nr:hypothetical protein [Planctomycetota bacterium]MCB9935268.1 hypothetical protein [Planctomycetota bacterium]
MNRKFAPYRKWIGEWAGRGVSKTNVPVHTRLTVRTRLAGQALEFLVESMDMESNRLIHGVIATLGEGPDGQLRMAVLSTLHGAIAMPVTPEDPGALAIEGVSVTGNHVVVSLIEDGDGLMLTGYWRPEGVPNAEPIGHSNIRMTRIAP